MIAATKPFVERGIPVVGLEPSSLLTLRDEFPALCPGPEASALAGQAFLLEEFLVQREISLPLKPMVTPSMFMVIAIRRPMMRCRRCCRCWA